MNSARVFYSWQSDLPPRATRNVIEKALEMALKGVNSRFHLDLSLDQDSRGEAGSPVIPDAVQGKIITSVAFVADLSIVARREKGGGLPNGCVAIEWGWAEQALGSDAMIGVMNTFYGEARDLPVDIRPYLIRATFELNETPSSQEHRHASRNLLAEHLQTALERSLYARFFRGFHRDAPAVVRHMVTASSDARGREDYVLAELANAVGLPLDPIVAVASDLIRFGLTEGHQRRMALRDLVWVGGRL